MFLPLFGGYFIDKIGIRTSILVFALLVSVGHAIFAIGVTQKSYLLALLGRGIFGCGGENLNLSQTLIIVQWFSGKELSMAIGLSISLARLGSVLSNNLEPLIVEAFSLTVAIWLGFWMCIISVISVIFMNRIDRKRDEMLGITSKHVIREEDKFSFSGMKNLGSIYWVMVANNVAVYCSIYCFTFVSSHYYQHRFGYDSVQAGFIISIVFFTGMVFCPVAGIFADRLGKRGLMIIAATVLVMLVHVFFLLTPDSTRPILPIFYLVVLGVGYAVYTTVIWASISYVVPARFLGTAFGLGFAASNTGLVIGPLVVGYIQDNTEKHGGYFWVSVFLALLGAIGVATAIIIYIMDIVKGGAINKKHSDHVEEVLHIDVKGEIVVGDNCKHE